MNRHYSIFIFLCIVSAVTPLVARNPATKSAVQFPEWPMEFGGLPLQELPLTNREHVYLKEFPGKIARFTDGEREIVMRYVATPSRKLHPTADCLRGNGLTVSPLPLFQDSRNKIWGCVSAVSDRGERLKVCEQIIDIAGETFSDTSTWFWAAMLEQSHGPWLAVSVAEDLS